MSKQLRCGECGGARHELFVEDDGLTVICVNCPTITRITPKVGFNMTPADNSPGCLAEFP